MNDYLPEGMLISAESNLICVSSAENLTDAMEKATILEARAALCDAACNIIVYLGGVPGIIPKSETVMANDGEIKKAAITSRVGKPVCFRIVSAELDEGGRPVKFMLSRKQVQREASDFMLSNFKCGDIIPAIVTHLEPFGAFVDIGCGFISMIGIENISVSRISHPEERFSVGQRIYAAVLGVDAGNKRIELTHKELLGTWQENADRFSPGDTVPGVVRSIKNYGIFVELAPNLSGLSEPCDGIEEGDQVLVYIKSINPERMKIKLVLMGKLHEKAERWPELRYFITGGRLDRWRYSTGCCTKQTIETVFSKEDDEDADQSSPFI